MIPPYTGIQGPSQVYWNPFVQKGLIKLFISTLKVIFTPVTLQGITHPQSPVFKEKNTCAIKDSYIVH